MARKAAAGTGTIRKKTITRGGKQYTYWEARATVGYDPGTGKQIQRTFTAKTQKEVAQKLKAATAALDDGTYTAPSKMTVSQWLDIWTTEYLGGVKPATVASYKTIKDTHLKPGLGATKLEALNAHTIQGFLRVFIAHGTEILRMVVGQTDTFHTAGGQDGRQHDHRRPRAFQELPGLCAECSRRPESGPWHV